MAASSLANCGCGSIRGTGCRTLWPTQGSKSTTGIYFAASNTEVTASPARQCDDFRAGAIDGRSKPMAGVRRLPMTMKPG